MKTAYLILENGAVFKGGSFGYFKSEGVVGEIVFTTGMTGYLETLTDQSYYGQIVLQTFPLIGNYGVIPSDFESVSVGAKAYITKHPCQDPSNFRSEGNLDAFLREREIPGLCGIDTRKLTKMIRENGVMNGKISYEPITDLSEIKAYKVSNAVASVSPASVTKSGSGSRKIALMDFGAKNGIANALIQRGCEVWTFPHDAALDDITRIKPDGIMLSNGPGDPAAPENAGIVGVIRELMKTEIPIFGICLGHQLLALANGYKTRKLKFGHRGANQPVKETETGRVYITSQNHGYEVIANAKSASFGKFPGKCSFINVNDDTCEGINYGVSFSAQFHPEARGGPLDTGFLFDKFMERINAYAS